MTDFYDQLAPFYHLVYQDWDASVRRQGEQLSALIKAEWPSTRSILDVSCGIGTQAIGLALQGYSVHASDLSEKAIERAMREARDRHAVVSFSVCDMREVHAHHGTGFDVVVSADNALPHLLTDEDILLALRQMTACLPDGGGCVVTVRDYESEARGKNLVKPYGIRFDDGYRYRGAGRRVVRAGIEDAFSRFAEAARAPLGRARSALTPGPVIGRRRPGSVSNRKV
jgi:SAM-dependent methyltransferase